jgi:molybdenum cofactor cytidylyltransferase
VLAAGSSSRLGSNKLLIELGGEPVVRRAARTALEAGLSPVVVVVGFEAEPVTSALEGLSVQTVLNRRHDEGMHSSVQAGVNHLGPECDAAIVILADMPLVTPAMLREMVTRFRAGAPLVISRYGEVQAPPTLYERSLLPALGSAGTGCGRRVVREHAHLAAAVDWPPELLVDLDLPQDVERVRSIIG